MDEVDNGQTELVVSENDRESRRPRVSLFNLALMMTDNNEHYVEIRLNGYSGNHRRRHDIYHICFNELDKKAFQKEVFRHSGIAPSQQQFWDKLGRETDAANIMLVSQKRVKVLVAESNSFYVGTKNDNFYGEYRVQRYRRRKCLCCLRWRSEDESPYLELKLLSCGSSGGSMAKTATFIIEQPGVFINGERVLHKEEKADIQERTSLCGDCMNGFMVVIVNVRNGLAEGVRFFNTGEDRSSDSECVSYLQDIYGDKCVLITVSGDASRYSRKTLRYLAERFGATTKHLKQGEPYLLLAMTMGKHIEEIRGNNSKRDELNITYTHRLKNSESALLEFRKTNEDIKEFWTDPEFDISNQHLKKIFKMISQGQREIGYSKLAHGLQALQIPLEIKSLKDLAAQIDINKNEGITEREFIDGIQMLAIQSRSLTSREATCTKLQSFFVYDWDVNAFSTLVFDESNIGDFFSNLPDIEKTKRSFAIKQEIKRRSQYFHGEHKEDLLEISPSPVPTAIIDADKKKHLVRWVYMAGHHRPTCVKLHLMYNLSSLELEDILDPTERTRLFRHPDGHIQIVMKLIRMKKKKPLRLKFEPFSIFWIPKDHTIITIQQKHSDLITYRLKKRLAVNTSKVRMNGSAYFMYSLLDRIVDEAFRASKAFNKELKRLENDIRKGEGSTHIQQHIRDIYRIKKELSRLRSHLRPINGVIARLVEMLEKDIIDKTIIDTEGEGEYAITTTELTILLHDVLDHINSSIKGIDNDIDWCASIEAMVKQFIDNTQSQALFLLALVSFIFIPLQFVTGVYGMNFYHMPELTTKYGYTVFWLCIALIAFALTWFLKHKGCFRILGEMSMSSNVNTNGGNKGALTNIFFLR